MKVLVTGGAGYIGSITCKALIEAGHQPVILDSLVKGPREFVRDRIFYEGEISDKHLVRYILSTHSDIEAVIHMASRILVPESAVFPHVYYENNVGQSIDFFKALTYSGVHRVVFSSSASVYAPVPEFEVTETSPLAPASPYARTKLMIEQILEDMSAADLLRSISLRYFNPIGADPDLEFGPYVRNPSHIMGRLVDAAMGRTDAFTITGVDHPTRDGTGIRDYIHVWDLARAHVAAVEDFDSALGDKTSDVINVGTGVGTTVRELLSTFEAVSDLSVPVQEAGPRAGDAVGAFANVDKALEVLGWASGLDIQDAIESTLEWEDRRREIFSGWRVGGGWV